MKKLLLSVGLAVSMFASSHHWGYTGENGPSHWGDLNEEFIMCKIGKNQAPIDINSAVVASLPDMDLQYKTSSYKVENNGHTIKVSVKKGNYLLIDGKKFELLQFHFHTPSENTINGKHFPMEMHLVHKSKDGELAVVSLMFKIGNYNSELAKIIKSMPQEKDEKFKLTDVYPVNFLPSNMSYYRFNGSLTTPPCSEGVRWIVIKEPVEMSAHQYKVFHKIMHNNNRPTQPLNARLILE